MDNPIIYRDENNIKVNNRLYRKVTTDDISDIIRAYEMVLTGHGQPSLYSISNLGLYESYVHFAKDRDDYTQVIFADMGMYPMGTFPYVSGPNYFWGCDYAQEIVKCGVTVDFPGQTNVRNLALTTRDGCYSDIILDPCWILGGFGKSQKNLRNAVNRANKLVENGKLEFLQDQDISVDDMIEVWESWHNRQKYHTKTKGSKAYKRAFEFHQALVKLGKGSTTMYKAKKGDISLPVHFSCCENVMPSDINGTFTYWNYMYVPGCFPEPLWLGIYNDCNNYCPRDGWIYNAQYALEYKDKQKTENNLKTKTKYSDYTMDEWKILRPKFGAYFRKADGRLD